jgi:1,4-alpha-glucan branching enzyme
VMADNAEDSVLAFLRLARRGPPALVVCNFTPVPRQNLLVGVPEPGLWREVLNTDSEHYGGSGIGNMGGVDTQPVPWHGRPRTLTVTVPPLACVVFVHQLDEVSRPERRLLD